VVSTVKHFTLNAQEIGRMMAESRIEEAAHRESDLVAFQSAIEDGQPGSVMPGYNLINGHSRGGTRSDRNADDFGPRLAAFGRVHLQSGESRAVELHLEPPTARPLGRRRRSLQHRRRRLRGPHRRTRLRRGRPTTTIHLEAALLR
jgi:hypothetical protein